MTLARARFHRIESSVYTFHKKTRPVRRSQPIHRSTENPPDEHKHPATRRNMLIPSWPCHYGGCRQRRQRRLLPVAAGRADGSGRPNFKRQTQARRRTQHHHHHECGHRYSEFAIYAHSPARIARRCDYNAANPGTSAERRRRRRAATRSRFCTNIDDDAAAAAQPHRIRCTLYPVVRERAPTIRILMGSGRADGHKRSHAPNPFA